MHVKNLIKLNIRNDPREWIRVRRSLQIAHSEIYFYDCSSDPVFCRLITFRLSVFHFCEQWQIQKLHLCVCVWGGGVSMWRRSPASSNGTLSKFLLYIYIYIYIYLFIIKYRGRAPRSATDWYYMDWGYHCSTVCWPTSRVVHVNTLTYRAWGCTPSRPVHESCCIVWERGLPRM